MQELFNITNVLFGHTAFHERNIEFYFWKRLGMEESKVILSEADVPLFIDINTRAAPDSPAYTFLPT